MKHLTFPALIVLIAVPTVWAMGLARASEDAGPASSVSGAPSAQHWHGSGLSPGISRAALHTAPQNNEGASWFPPPTHEEDNLDSQGAPLRGDRFHWNQP
jgi:hypothetical protein